jgi:hypothetical protein
VWTNCYLLSSLDCLDGSGSHGRICSGCSQLLDATFGIFESRVILIIVINREPNPTIAIPDAVDRYIVENIRHDG